MTIADFNSFDSEWWHYKFEIRLDDKDFKCEMGL
jgi:D-alanyl-D-alanine dipeptidase